MPSPLDNLDDLLDEADRLNDAIKDGIIEDDIPSDRTARRAHQLREALGLALVHAERLARSTGNDPRVVFDEGTDETGLVSYMIEAGSLSPPPDSPPSYPVTIYCEGCDATTAIDEDVARDHYDQADTWAAIQAVLHHRGWHQSVEGTYCPSCSPEASTAG